MRYPDQSVILTWGDVPKAAGYTVEIADNARLQQHRLDRQDRPSPSPFPTSCCPTAPTGGASGRWTRPGPTACGATSPAWPRPGPTPIAGTRMAATPDRRLGQLHGAEPVPVLEPGPGRQELRRRGLPGRPVQQRRLHAASTRPSRSRRPAPSARCPTTSTTGASGPGTPTTTAGPWTVASTFTKAWTRPTQVAPADGATTDDLQLSWEPIDGAQRYEVQITDQEFNWSGSPLVVAASTAATAFAPTLNEEKARDMMYGTHWWRVRPVVERRLRHLDPTARRVNWQRPQRRPTAAPTSLDRRHDHRAVSPILSWTPDHRRDPVPRQHRRGPPVQQPGRAARSSPARRGSRARPLPDNQIGTGYYWRVVWGNGASIEDPTWMVDEDIVPVGPASRKQTQVTLGARRERRRGPGVRRC